VAKNAVFPVFIFAHLIDIGYLKKTFRNGFLGPPWKTKTARIFFSRSHLPVHTRTPHLYSFARRCDLAKKKRDAPRKHIKKKTCEYGKSTISMVWVYVAPTSPNRKIRKNKHTLDKTQRAVNVSNL